MQAPSVGAVVAYLGIVVQLGGATLLVVLFALLRRHVPRRSYFGAWTIAWLAVFVAIAALFIRYHGLARPANPSVEEESRLAVRVLYSTYQLCKLIAFVFFVVGTRLYVSGGNHRPPRAWVVVLAIAYTVASAVLARRTLNGMVVWQAALAVPAAAYCALALFSLPRSRRTLGSVGTATGFAMLALLWSGYAVAFGITAYGSGAWPAPVSMVVNYNSYFDLLVNMMLGYGMVVLVMEDAKREVADAHAELRVAHDQMSRAALYDSLTDSLNRRAFAQGVGLEMARGAFGTVVVADLDDMKDVNDGFGHSAGDQLLRHTADLLRSTLRPYDKLYRWGGDEFLLVIPSAHAADVLERLEQAIATAAPLVLGESPVSLPLAISFGAADYASAEELQPAIQAADRAMYDAKRRRKGEPRNSPAPAGDVFATVPAGVARRR